MFRRILRLVTSVAMLCLVACFDDNPSDASVVSPESSGTSVVSGESSSSVETIPGSSAGGSAVNSSSSVKTPKNTAACLWNASKGENLVNTGLDPDSTRAAGLWYVFGDDHDGGLTESYNPYNVCDYDDGSEYNCVKAVIEYCGCYCAEFIFRKGTSAEIFGGMGFNVAGIEEPKVSYVLRDGDISDWGGICVTYAADGDVLLRLYTDDDTFYQTEFGKSTEFVEKCVTWDALNAAEASKHASSIYFVMPGADSTKGHLSIAAVGKYDANGACEVDGYAYVLPKKSYNEGIIALRSSSSKQSSSEQSSSSGIAGPCTTPESVSDLWYGPSDIYGYVNTGLDNGSETSGYWFSFGDEEADTYVSWPVMQYEYETSLDPLIEECGGVCGTFKYRDEGATGIGFNVAGEALSGNNGVPDIADVSAWGGLCVTYASETDMDVVMSNDTAFTYIKKMALMPKISLPKSVEVKTVCSKWSDFVSAVETPSDPTRVASILFVAYGEADAANRFKVIGVGKYTDAKNVCKQGADPFVSRQLWPNF